MRVEVEGLGFRVGLRGILGLGFWLLSSSQPFGSQRSGVRGFDLQALTAINKRLPTPGFRV